MVEVRILGEKRCEQKVSGRDIGERYRSMEAGAQTNNVEKP